jgi:hypothetical protein
MNTINVEGLPEPIAQAMDAMARLMREQLAIGRQEKSKTDRITLPTRSGTVIGELTRDEIYEDVG